MSQSFPWMAQEAGLFKKYNIDFNLVFISSSSIVTAALLGGDTEMTITGGIGNVAAYVKGSTDIVFTGGVKNVMTQTLVAGGNIKRPEDLKGKRIGVSRIGGNSHYFTIQALRRHGMEPNRDYSFLQTGGDPETLAALMSGSVGGGQLDAADRCPSHRQGLSLCNLRSRLEDPLFGNGVCHQALGDGQTAGRWSPTSCAPWRRLPRSCTPIANLYYKVLGKYLRITGPQRSRFGLQRRDQSAGAATGDQARILASDSRRAGAHRRPRQEYQAAGNGRQSLSRRDEQERFYGSAVEQEVMARVNQRVEPGADRGAGKKVKPVELTDPRFLNDMEKSGFWDQIWAKR